jgi:hypothetical protein
MNDKETSQSNSPTIFHRLNSRGIDYVEIKKLISLDLPHATLYLERHFGPHTAPQILRQAKRWRQLLTHDFILQAEQRKEMEKTLSQWELFAWNALIETSFPKLGAWNLSRMFLQTHIDHEPRYIHPDIQIVAIHEKTREKRVAVIPGGPASVAARGDEWRKAFAELGILDLVLKGQRRVRLVSARRSQAWPIFTKMVIPRLYDFLAPFYRKRGHVWSDKEEALKRDAFFPRELFEDLRDVLQVEHPDVFPHLTLNQLKAAVQRHLARLRKSTKSAK